MSDNNAPATKQDLLNLEDRLVEKMDDRLVGKLQDFEDRLVKKMDDRLVGKLQDFEDRLVKKMDDRLVGKLQDFENRLVEQMRDMQTGLLRGFSAFSEGQTIRLRKVEADQSNLDAALSARVNVVEKRLLEIEIRLGKTH